MLMNPGTVAAERFDLGIHANMLSPQGEFANAIDNKGWGISVEGFFKPGTFPLKIGLQAGYALYGISKRTEPFSSTIPDVRVDVKTTNNIVTTHAVARLQHQFGIFSPYVDGLVGFHYLFTETAVQDQDYDEPIASSTNIDDITLSYGFGGGLSTLLYAFGDKGNYPEKIDMLLDFSLRYLFGGEAEYLTKGDIRVDDGEVVYSASRSKTDRLMVNVGLVFRF